MRRITPAAVLAAIALSACSPPDAPPADATSREAVTAPVAAATNAAPTAPGPTIASTPSVDDADAMPDERTRLALSGDGLALVTAAGATHPLRFDLPAAQAIDAVTRVLGVAPELGRNEECGAGPLDMASWPNGLTLVLQDGRFVGWSASPQAADARGEPLATMAGVGPGRTRRELESAYAARIEETTLGTEFEAGGLSGVLDGRAPDARIDAMWAGTSCVFR